MKSTNGNVTKYVYGLGLIGEEKQSSFKTYHFDYRGSTVAITDESGVITDTFQYDTYGKLLSRTGSTFVIFGYNGRDGVVTDKNGLIYMRARYYAPELRRFVNADIIPGQISNAVTLNRYAYANGNPVSNVDPFGLCPREDKVDRTEYIDAYMKKTKNELYKLLQSWGISLTKSTYETSPYTSELINMFWGGFTAKIYIDVSFATPIDADINVDCSLDSDEVTLEITSPEITLPWEDISAEFGVYVDEERLSVGTSVYVSDGSWTYGSKHQVGLYSEAQIISLSYEPEDQYLPTVTISLDVETNHLVKLAIAGVAVAAVFVPEAVIVAAPTAIEFLQQLGGMAPAFA